MFHEDVTEMLQGRIFEGTYGCPTMHMAGLTFWLARQVIHSWCSCVSRTATCSSCQWHIMTVCAWSWSCRCAECRTQGTWKHLLRFPRKSCKVRGRKASVLNNLNGVLRGTLPSRTVKVMPNCRIQRSGGTSGKNTIMQSLCGPYRAAKMWPAKM